MNVFESLPTPKILINALRQIGYTFESAVADIIDNSITAKATFIDIFSSVSEKEEQYVVFLDDGIGMDREGIINALKIGSDFEGERDINDLGRFGMGLKSASFSQARNLTVASKIDNKVFAFGWDIREVEESNKWNCLEFEDDEIYLIPKINELLKLDSGTLVVWQNFDLLTTRLGTSEGLQDLISRNIDIARDHIALIFHRYLNNKLIIRINNDEIKGLDPFLENKSYSGEESKHRPVLKEKGDRGQLDRKGVEHEIIIRPYILPHLEYLKDDDFTALGGSEKLFTGQGFYIYRLDRLIIAGSWLNFEVKSNNSKYVRIMLEIPNAFDDIWDIDIKKQNAVLPPLLRNQLKDIVKKTCNQSKVQTTSPKPKQKKIEDSMWLERETREGKKSYHPNLDSEFINEYIIQNFEVKSHQKVKNLLELFALSIPYKQIENSLQNDTLSSDYDKETIFELANEAEAMIRRTADRRNESYKQVYDRMVKLEIFHDNSVRDVVKKRLGI